MKTKHIAGDIPALKFAGYLKQMEEVALSFSHNKITENQFYKELANIYISTKQEIEDFSKVDPTTILNMTKQISLLTENTIKTVYNVTVDDRIAVSLHFGGSVGRRECPLWSDVDYMLIGHTKEITDQGFFVLADGIDKLMMSIEAIDYKYCFEVDQIFSRFVLTDNHELLIFNNEKGTDKYIPSENLSEADKGLFKRALIDFVPSEQNHSELNYIRNNFNELAKIEEEAVKQKLTFLLNKILSQVKAYEFKVPIKRYVRLYQFFTYYAKLFMLNSENVLNMSIKEICQELKAQKLLTEEEATLLFNNYLFLLSTLNVVLKEKGTVMSIDKADEGFLSKYLGLNYEQVEKKLKLAYQDIKLLIDRFANRKE